MNRDPTDRAAGPIKRTLKVRVTKSSLRNATGRQLRPPRWWRRIGFGLHTKVPVEPWENGRCDSVFYAPFSDRASYDNRRSSETTSDESYVSGSNSNTHSESATPVRFVDIHPDAVPRNSLVDPSEDFEISFVGMAVPPFDFFRKNNNELLLFSVSTPPIDETPRSTTLPKSAKKLGEYSINKGHSSTDFESQPFFKSLELASEVACRPPISTLSDRAVPGMPHSTMHGGLGLSDIPRIHYDPDSDGHQAGTTPDTFVTIPASKSLFLQHDGGSSVQNGRSGVDLRTGSVPVRFTVMEIDRVTKAQASAVASAAQLGSIASASGIVVPYSNIISWAISIASDASLSQLKRYSRPDYVMSADMIFKLVKKNDDGSINDVHGKPIMYSGPYLQVRSHSPYFLKNLYYFSTTHVSCTTSVS